MPRTPDHLVRSASRIAFAFRSKSLGSPFALPGAGYSQMCACGTSLPIMRECISSENAFCIARAIVRTTSKYAPTFGTSQTQRWCFLGMTRVCPGDCGRMSRKARCSSSSYTFVDGISPLTILQNGQSTIFQALSRETEGRTFRRNINVSLSHRFTLVSGHPRVTAGGFHFPMPEIPAGTANMPAAKSRLGEIARPLALELGKVAQAGRVMTVQVITVKFKT